MLVGTEDELEGAIAVADEVRDDAKAAVQRLRDLGIDHLVMLTGDNERTAKAIAEQVGVDEFRAGLLPEEKVEAIEELGERYDGEHETVVGSPDLRLLRWSATVSTTPRRSPPRRSGSPWVPPAPTPRSKPPTSR